jgi:GrpB protein
MNRVLGLESGTVRVVPYDATWPLLFGAEVSRLVPIAASYGVTIVFEHTGSTAVPALAAKPGEFGSPRMPGRLTCAEADERSREARFARNFFDSVAA